MKGNRLVLPGLLALLLVVGACRPAADPGAPEPTAGQVEDELEGALAQLAERPEPSDAAALADRLAATGDPRWAPHLVDLLRVFGLGTDFYGLGTDPYLAALADLTGVPAPEEPLAAYLAYGSWVLEHRPDPADGYVAWKAALYGHLDPEFQTLLDQMEDPHLAAELQWGGVGRGGIPELNRPEVIPAARADYLLPDELVFGALVGGETRAYPLRILDVHELANDRLGGEEVVLANCTLCRSGLLYSRVVAGRTLDFQTSGLLRLSNKVMVDLQTDTLWDQLTGEALAGPLVGHRLERRSLVTTVWSEWVSDHPDTQVLALPIPDELGAALPEEYTYQPGTAYADYYASESLWFPAPEPPEVFEPKRLVGTVEVGGAALAVDLEALREAGPTLLEVEEVRVAAVPTARAGVRFFGPVEGDPPLAGARVTEEALVLSDGTRVPRLVGGTAFWFAWHARHPDTAWWPEG